MDRIQNYGQQSVEKALYGPFLLVLARVIHLHDLAQLFEPVIQSMGYELVGIEFSDGNRHGTLRVYIDREAGVNIDDCAAISHQISAILDVEEPIQQAYDLEISSPGIDRPLFYQKDYERFTGRMAKI